MNINTVIKEGTKPSVARRLTPHDRCDRCGAQALVRVRLRAGTLDWCGHHWKQYEDRIDVFVIEVDDRAALDAEERGAAALNQGKR